MINIPEYKNAERVFYYFEEISKIPHGSENTSIIANYLVSFAELHGLEFYRDGADNVVIKKPATAGYENRPTVILQGHTDMVAEKSPGLEKNMLTDGLEIYRDGDFLRAKGTTLGADDGIAIAYALAILEADDIRHPNLEALFTSDEEVGLIGAGALDASVLNGKIMINIDSDEEGIFTVGCAGGARVDITLPAKYENTEKENFKKITVSGLLGGHSGVEINKGRANAVKLLGEILSRLPNIKIAEITGGNADNAIPRDASAVVLCENDISNFLYDAENIFRKTYGSCDPNIRISAEKCENYEKVLSDDTANRILGIINDNKSGVIFISEEIEGLPESSENLGIVKLDKDSFKCTFSVRSSKASRKAELIEALEASAKKHGASLSVRGDYPAWEYKKDSKIRDISCKIFRKIYGKEPKITVIHAGLECGIFSDKIEGLDCISLGPDNFDIHTTEEHLSISSAARVYEFLKEVLAEI